MKAIQLGMKRKIVKQGNSALTITLPSTWAKKFELEAGDEVEVEEQGDSIIIKTKETTKGKKAYIDVRGLDIMIYRVLGALYKTGYDELEIHFETSDEFEAVQEVIRQEFIGFEVVDHQKNILRAKRISKIEHEEFETLLRRMFMIIKLMGEDTLEAIKKNDQNQLKIIALRDKDINKIADYCRRILNLNGQAITNKIGPLYFIVEQLEKIGDLYRDICLYCIDKKIKSDKEIEQSFFEINEFFASFYSLFFKFDLNAIVDFGKKRYLLRAKIKDKIENTKETRFFSYFNQLLESVFDMNGPLMTLKL